MSIRKMKESVAVCAALAAALLVALAAPAAAQVTTGNLSGTVTATSDGSAIPGATVVATHVPTNTAYSAVTDANGFFRMINLRVGGPYKIEASLDGFEPGGVTDIMVPLGDTANVEFDLKLAGVSEEIVVVGEATFINPDKMGSSSKLESAQIERFPTVRRNILLDGARANPYASIRASDDNQKDISFAGRSSKYNNIQIDGSNYNDLFGLGESGGTPGGQTNSQPVQQDVVAELQVSVSPYDVRQGGFTGGVINAVTKSGTNDFHGSAYWAKRDPDYVGDGPFDSPVRYFDEEQYGASLGGPIVRDKVWFFAAGENNSKGEQSGVSADGSAGTQYGKPDDAAHVQSVLQTKYGYDAGGLGDIPIDTDSKHYFGRIDWNVADGHQLTARYSVVDAQRDDVANRGTSVFRFPNATFARDAQIKSGVVQLNSVFGNSVFNEARIGSQSLQDERVYPTAFPSIEIGGTGPRRGALIAGVEQFSGVNKIDQKIFELHDDVTLLKGDHTWTIGTHNEFFDIKNYFLASAFGYYYFPTLAAFDAGIASEYQISFIDGPDPYAAASVFKVEQYGIYAGDQWRVRDNLTFTYGLRADLSSLPDKPNYNPTLESALGIDTTNVPGDTLILSPRIGFNWDPNSDGVQQVRGGIGIFAGRTPYVWISNVYAGSGIGSVALTSRGSIPFNPDPLNQPHSGAGSTPSVDVIDPDFEFPQVMRATLGYDRELPWNMRGTAEVVWSRTMQDIYYVNANKMQTGTNATDGRPTYSSISSAFFGAYQLTNTTIGQDTVVSLQLSRPSRGGLGFNAGYTWMDSNNAFDGTSSRAVSNWQFHPTRGDLFKPEEATSSWENEHRFYLNAYYDVKTGPVTHSFGLFYNVESGRPFSILTGGDPNGDGFTSNDLLYIPASADEVVLNGFTWDQFATYVESVGLSTDGKITKRNAAHGPWVRRLDFHYGLELPIKVVRAQITLDMINLLNFFDKDQGVVRYVPFGTTTPIRITGTSGGKPIYSQNFSNAITNLDSPYSTSDILSRWQARLGLRLSF